MSRIILSYLSQVSRVLLLFFLSLVLSREYGAIDKGKFDYTLLIFNIILNFGHFGLNNASLYFFNKYKNIYLKIIKANFTLLIILYAFYFLILNNQFIQDLLSIQLGTSILFAGILYACSLTLSNELKNLFVSINRINTVNTIELTSNTINTIAIIIAIFLNFEIENFIVIYLMSYFLKILISIIILIRYKNLGVISKNSYQIDTNSINILKNQVKFATAIYLSTFFVFMNYRIDQLFIKNFSGFADLGVYSLAVSLSELIFIVHLGIVNILNSQMLNSKNIEDKIKGYKKYLKFSGILLLILVPIAIAMSNLITVVFGQEFKGAVPVFIILIIANTIASFAKVSFSFLYSENKNNFHLFVTFFTVSINIILNFLLIPDYGMLGAAYASLISYMFYSISYFVYMKKKYL
ncbi:MATE family efflux transporter [Bacillus solitudinis]|uniref:polysaccharide biosynthesis C-terminal domain-containing protein n=1 Tax=Bacillus solitudinis TaxID=2014074 RepID=UPI000C24A216|nr:polysaccharide biosynthesis C-terminal domain-containing protein [Bacillus solitudinis]